MSNEFKNEKVILFLTQSRFLMSKCFIQSISCEENCLGTNFTAAHLRCCNYAQFLFHSITYHVVEMMLHAKEVLALDLVDHVLANLEEQTKSDKLFQKFRKHDRVLNQAKEKPLM